MKPLNFGKPGQHYQNCWFATRQRTHELGSYVGSMPAISIALPSEKPASAVWPCLWSIQRE